MDPLHSPLSAARVLVVPVGRIRTATFRAALGALRAHAAEASLATLSPPVWGSLTFPQGAVVFDYVTQHDDLMAALEDFQRSRGVLAVVGIASRSDAGLGAISSPDPVQDGAADDNGENAATSAAATAAAALGVAVAHFASHVVPKYPSSIAHRVLVLDPAPASTTALVGLSETTAATLLAQVPAPEPGSGRDEIDCLLDYLHGSFAPALAGSLLAGLEKHSAALEARSVIGSPPATVLGGTVSADGAIAAAIGATGGMPLGAGDMASPTSPLSMAAAAAGSLASAATGAASSLALTHEQRLRKRAPARAAKLAGDLYLVAGRLPAAIDKYLEAVDASRVQNDTLWVAASMDALYCAMLALRGRVRNAHDALPSLPAPVREWLQSAGEPEIAAKFREIAATYERADAPVLAADVAIRLARSIADRHHDLLRVPAAAADAVALATAAVANVAAPTSVVDARAQVRVALAAASVATRAGYRRKQGLFMYVAVAGTARVLARSGAAARVDATTQAALMDALAHLYGLRTADNVGWPAVQTAVLEACMGLADAVDDDGAGLRRLIVRCFQRLQSVLSLDGMLDVVARLQRGAGTPGAVTAPAIDDEEHVAGRQFAFLKGTTVVPPTAARQAHKRPQAAVDGAAKDPFLYSAFARRATQAVCLVTHEPVAFTCHLVNPFSFVVTLEGLVLRASITAPTDDDDAGESKPSAGAFVADAINVTLPAHGQVVVTLRGTPTTLGTLRVDGCAFRIFGVREQCTLTRSTAGPSAKIKASAMDLIHRPTETAARMAASGSPHGGAATTRRSPSGGPHGADAPSGSDASALEWAVLPPLPLLKMRPVGAAHRHLMLLEGERRSDLALHLHNQSSVEVTDIRVLVVESRVPRATGILGAAAASSGVGGGIPTGAIGQADGGGSGSENLVATAPAVDEGDPIAVHDHDRYDTLHAVLAVAADTLPASIAPGASAVVPLDAFGKRACTAVAVLVEYGAAACPAYLRRIEATVHVSIAPSVSIAAIDVARAPGTAAGDSVVVYVDVANGHSAPVRVRVACKDKSSTHDAVDENSSADGDMVVVQAGSTRRCVVTVPRCTLPEAALVAEVPEIKAKQFVMTRHGKRPPNYRDKLMCFWLREYLLSQIQGQWWSDDSHHGDLDVSAMHILPRHVPVLWEQSIDVAVARVQLVDVSPHVREVVVRVRNHAADKQSFLVQLHVDPLAPVRVLGHPVYTLCDVSGGTDREIAMRVLATSASAWSVPWTVTSHTTRVGVEHSLVRVSKHAITLKALQA